MCCLWLLVVASTLAGARGGGFQFFSEMRGGDAASRRVFGGSVARPWPPACALLDRSLAARCSGAVLAPRWALTAAHCAEPKVAYVRYNNDDLAPVHLLYAHPEYLVRHADEGAGMDVVQLHHDVGLVRTRRDMALAAPAPPAPRAPAAPAPPKDPLIAMTEYGVNDIMGQEVEVLGYGRSERAGAGVMLRAARLRVAECSRGGSAWRHCGCAEGDAAGVCSGDSGGPVVYKGRQIGVTSMGPLECAARPALMAGDARAAQPALSVFTALKPYTALINATMLGTDHAVRMRAIPARGPPPAGLRLLLCAAPLLALNSR